MSAQDDAMLEMIAAEKRRLRALQQAREELDAESAPPIPQAFTLTDFLAQPDRDVQYRVDQLQAAGGNVLMWAVAKAGKTTIRDNYARSWCDGDPFLDRWAIKPARGRLVIIDAELPPDTGRRWLRRQGIAATDRCVYVNIKGQVQSFRITSASVRAAWAQQLIQLEADSLWVDCVSPVLSVLGIGENDPGAVRGVLECISALAVEAGIPEVIVSHHAGRDGDHSRGATAFDDWPDAMWQLRWDGIQESPRYFSAFGRDVDVPQTELIFDYGRLTAGELRAVRGGPKSRATSRTTAELIEWLDEHGVSSLASRRDVGGRLRENDMTVGTNQLAEVVRIRKARK